MGPDDTITAGQVFFAPPGTPLPVAGEDLLGFTPIGFLHNGVDFAGGQEAADEIVYSMDAVLSVPLSWTVTFHVTPVRSVLIKLFCHGDKMPRRKRKRYDQAKKAEAKQWRAESRAAQRRAIGTKEES